MFFAIYANACHKIANCVIARIFYISNNSFFQLSFCLPCSQGGLMPNQVVQLSNGGMAMVVEADDEKVILDANSMLAGKTLTFHLEMLSIERGTFL